MKLLCSLSRTYVGRLSLGVCVGVGVFLRMPLQPAEPSYCVLLYVAWYMALT